MLISNELSGSCFSWYKFEIILNVVLNNKELFWFSMKKNIELLIEKKHNKYACFSSNEKAVLSEKKDVPLVEQ